MYAAITLCQGRANSRRVRVQRLLLVCLLPLLIAFGGCAAPVAPHTPPHIDSALSILTQHSVLRASDGTVRWTGDLGIDPPTVSGGVAYAETFANVTYTVSARRIEDGTVLWTYQLPLQSGEMGPITIANGLVVLSTLQSGGLVLVALQASTGTIVWRSASIPAVVEPTVDVREPFVSRPAFSAGLIIAGLDSARNASFVVAWNITDGSLAWRKPLSGAAPYAGAGVNLVVCGSTVVTWYDGDGNGFTLHIGALDPHTGAPTWSIAEDGGEAIAIAHRIIVITQPTSYTVTAVRPNDGTTLWRWRANSDSAALPTNPFGLRELFADDSAILFQRLDRLDSCALGTPTSAVTPNPADLRSQRGCPQLFAVNATTGSLLWQRILDVAPVYNDVSSFAGNGAFYYKYFNDKLPLYHFMLVSFDANSGALRWKQEIGGYTAAESAHDGVIYSLFQARQIADKKVIALNEASVSTFGRAQ